LAAELAQHVAISSIDYSEVDEATRFVTIGGEREEGDREGREMGREREREDGREGEGGRKQGREGETGREVSLSTH